MNVHPLLVDGVIAAVLAALVVVLVSGPATVGLIAAVVLAACALTVLVDRWRARGPRPPRRRSRRRLR